MTLQRTRRTMEILTSQPRKMKGQDAFCVTPRSIVWVVPTPVSGVRLLKNRALHGSCDTPKPGMDKEPTHGMRRSEQHFSMLIVFPLFLSPFPLHPALFEGQGRLCSRAARMARRMNHLQFGSARWWEATPSKTHTGHPGPPDHTLA